MHIEVAIEELRNLAITALASQGFPAVEASVIVDDYLDADLRGRESHGFASFSVALSSARPDTGPTIEQTGAASLRVDGGGQSGHVVARRAIDEALHRLPTAGVVAAGITNITRFNCPGPIARYGAERGAVTIVLEYGGQAFMPAPNGVEPVLSTNPLGFAVPGAEPLLVADLATSHRAIGYVALAKAAGERLSSPWGIDMRGLPTDDPEAVCAVAPAAGYKGFAMALIVEVLAGCLTGTPVGTEGTLGRRGAFVVVLDPRAFGAGLGFINGLRGLLRSITESSPVRSDRPGPAYPGMRGEERRAQGIKSGRLRVPEDVLANIRRLADVPHATLDSLAEGP